MECTTCQARAAIGACAECRTALCDDCGITCQRCKKMVCKKHASKTPHGRLLCPSCMDARNASAEKKRRERLGVDAAKPVEQSKPGAAPAAKPKPKAEEDTSFAALAGDDPDWIRPAEAEARDQEMDDEDDEREPEEFEEAEPKREVKETKRDPFAVSGKLDLGPIDEKRPILTASARQSPAYWKYPVALIFFLIAAWYVYDRVPPLRWVVAAGMTIGVLAFAIWGIRVLIARSQALKPDRD